MLACQLQLRAELVNEVECSDEADHEYNRYPRDIPALSFVAHGAKSFIAESVALVSCARGRVLIFINDIHVVFVSLGHHQSEHNEPLEEL